jgi:hypothetical protein
MIDPAVRLYRKEKARKQKRDARKIEQARKQYVTVCERQKLRPMTDPNRVAKTARRAA